MMAEVQDWLCQSSQGSHRSLGADNVKPRLGAFGVKLLQISLVGGEANGDLYLCIIPIHYTLMPFFFLKNNSLMPLFIGPDPELQCLITWSL